MPLLTFDQIHATVAAFHAAEAARNTPSALACAALETLRAALAEMGAEERADVLVELYALAVEVKAEEWEAFGVALRTV